MPSKNPNACRVIFTNDEFPTEPPEERKYCIIDKTKAIKNYKTTFSTKVGKSMDGYILCTAKGKKETGYKPGEELDMSQPIPIGEKKMFVIYLKPADDAAAAEGAAPPPKTPKKAAKKAAKKPGAKPGGKAATKPSAEPSPPPHPGGEAAAPPSPKSSKEESPPGTPTKKKKPIQKRARRTFCVTHDA